MTQGERITALEVKVEELNKKLTEVDRKLDELLALRNKGAGVFWLVSSLLGASIIGGVIQLMTWIKG